MIWPKNPIPPKGMEQEPAGQQEPCPESLITGIGLSCIAGDQPFALLGAVGAGLSGARPNPVLQVPVPGQKGEQPVMSAPVADLDGIDHPAERMAILSGLALARAAESLADDMDGEKVLVVTLLPGQDTARGAETRIDELEEVFRGQVPQLNSAVFRFVDRATGSTRPLIEVCRELACGAWQAVLFGGVDSLVDTVSCTELALAGRIMTAGGAEGMVPGEGAAYLVLQPGESETSEALARIAGAFQAEEPHSGQADCQKMTGLASAMEQALGQGNLSANSLCGVVLPFGADTAGSLEWHQASLKLWPAGAGDPPEQARQPSGQESHREEMPLHVALGETGAAAFPLSLALACARFEFAHPKLNSMLVCDAGDSPLRGAVLLQTGKKG